MLSYQWGGQIRYMLFRCSGFVLGFLLSFYTTSARAQANLVSDAFFSNTASWIVSDPSYTAFNFTLSGTPPAALLASGATSALDAGCVGSACLTYPPVLGTSASAAQVINTTIGESHYLIFWTYFSAASTPIETIQTDAWWGNTPIYSVQPTAEGWTQNIFNLGAATTASNTLTFLLRNDPSFSQVTFAQVLPYPRLTVSKTGPSSLTVTQPGTYTVIVTNHSPGITATAVTLSDTFSPAAPSAAITGISCSAFGTAACPATLSLPTAAFNLPPSSSLSFQISITAAASTTGTLSNNARVTSTQRSTLTSVLSATATSTIFAPAQLSLSKTNNTTSTLAGGTTLYQITANNAGPAWANQALIKDTPSAGLNCNNLSCLSSGGASCPSSPTVSTLTTTGLAIPVFPSGGSVTLLLSCQVLATGI
jgi:uncharacterized repeat protein (TIGR01451 family)